MQEIPNVSLQNIVGRVHQEEHEAMVHLVCTRLHKLMHRTVHMDMQLLPAMDDDASHAYVEEVVSKLAAIRNIPRMFLSSKRAGAEQVGRVLVRFTRDYVGVHMLEEGLPEHIALATLRLHLSNAQQLPQQTWQIYTLRDLDIQDCLCIQHIPPSMSDLTSLVSLSIGGCPLLADLRRLPASLHTLAITDCPGLQQLPANLDALGQLSTLSLQNLPIQAFAIGEQLSSSLTSLRVAHCSNLASLQIAACAQLRTLEVASCDNVPDFAINIDNYRMIHTLEVRNLPRIRAIGDTSSLQHLRTLRVNNCPLVQHDLGNLALSLHILALEACVPPTQIQHMAPIARNISQLHELHTLVLECPILQHMPFVERLSNLRTLHLACPQVGVSVPFPVGLHTLHINGWNFGNNYTGCPTNMDQLTGLTSLRLEHMALPLHALYNPTPPFPVFIHSMPLLQTLALSYFFGARGMEGHAGYTTLVDLQPQHLTHLTHLDVSGNRFRQVPFFPEIFLKSFHNRSCFPFWFLSKKQNFERNKHTTTPRSTHRCPPGCRC